MAFVTALGLISFAVRFKPFAVLSAPLSVVVYAAAALCLAICHAVSMLSNSFIIEVLCIPHAYLNK